MTDLRTTGFDAYYKSVGIPADISADDSPSFPTSAVLFSASAPDNMIVVEGYRGGRFRWHMNADADSMTATFWAIETLGTGVARKEYMATEIGVATLTAGTETSGGGSYLTPSRAGVWVDTVAWVADPFFTELLGYVNGVVRDYAPTNEIGELLLSDFGNIFGLVVVHASTVTANTNMIFKMDV